MRALKSRANNRGQTSNLYTLLLLEQTPTPDNDNTLDHQDTIDVPAENIVSTATVTHISFATLQAEKQEQAPVDVPPTSCNHARITKPQKSPHEPRYTPFNLHPLPCHYFYRYSDRQKKKQDNFCPAILLFIGGRGGGQFNTSLNYST